MAKIKHHGLKQAIYQGRNHKGNLKVLRAKWKSKHKTLKFMGHSKSSIKSEIYNWMCLH
jgi:hypothetical protein